jgi:hypothetical protein
LPGKTNHFPFGELRRRVPGGKVTMTTRPGSQQPVCSTEAFWLSGSELTTARGDIG